MLPVGLGNLLHGDGPLETLMGLLEISYMETSVKLSLQQGIWEDRL